MLEIKPLACVPTCHICLHCCTVLSVLLCCGGCHRDPNGLVTVEQFLASIQWACSGDFTQQDIDEAKLGVFAQVGNV